MGQDCDVDFPGVTITNYSSACGLPSVSNLTLGKNIYFGNGDVFTFDTNLDITGNLVVDVTGGGKIRIPAGVTINLDGNLTFDTKNSSCTLLNPCTFEIEVEGTLIVSGNLVSKLVSLVWTGNGMVIAESNFEDRGCMACGLLSCPEFQVIPAKCKDEGDCLGDFCTAITTCPIDLTRPVITGCPSDIVSNMTGPGCSQSVTWAPPMASDNCAVTSFVASHAPGTTFPKGTTVVTYTARDAAGNTTACSFNVTVFDLVAPVISSCPANVTINANASCQAVANWTAPTMSDNCAGGTLTSSHPSGSTFAKGVTTVTYTATDAAGNISTCSFTVTVVDNTLPVIVNCPANITLNANASCQAVPTWTAPTVTDNCPGAILTSTHTPGSNFPKGTTTVTYTATDAAGNKATCSFNVTVIDNVPPMIVNCPTNITVNAGASCQAVVNWTPPTTPDNCTGGTLSTTHAPGSTFAKGTTTVVYTATDAAGNAATCSFTVTVVDAAAPVITNCPANIIVNANSSCQAVASWTIPTLSDNCIGATLASTHSPGSTFNLGTTMVTYTATDAAGKSSTCSFNVVVQDAAKPVITNCPANITVNANSSCQAVVSWTPPTLSDNCSGATMSCTRSPGSTFNKGTTAVTYTATDAAGNTSTCTFNVIVQDIIKPVIAGCPANITVNANASCQAVVSWTAPTMSDNCTGATMNSNRAPGSTFGVGTTPVTYTATDASGNTQTCTFNVIVQDVTKPVISGCPSNITVNANSSCQAVVSWTAPAMTDNCSGASMSSTRSPGSTFNLGTTPVTYTATDAAGNISTCTFNVIVKDATKPVISGCPSNITVSAGASCQAVVNWTVPTVKDNCAGATMTSNRSPGTSFSLGTTPVTYTATDAAGNTSTCTFNVIVQDAVKPVISGCPSTITVNAASSCQAVVNWTAPSMTDNCTGGTMSSNRSPGSTFNIGTTPVTYTATDAAGNVTTCTFNVVVEVSRPVISACPSDIILQTGTSCQAIATWTVPTVSSSCSGATISSTHSPGTSFNIGTTPVTYTATDAAGNTSSCSFNVIVVDDASPVITNCPASITVNADATCKAIVSWTAPAFTDNCNGGSMTSTHSSGSAFEPGTTAVTYTATDASGNTSACSFNVIVAPSVDPVFVDCPESILVGIFSGESTPVQWNPPTLSAECNSEEIRSSHKPGDVFGIGKTNVSYSATTLSGATITCTFEVTVVFKGIIVHEVITPNGDGENDTWIIKNIENFANNDVVIFDRWGSIVYRAKGYDGSSTAWSGSNVPAGTYYYTLIVNAQNKNAEYKGFVELVK